LLVRIGYVVLIVLLVLLGIGIAYWATVDDYGSVRDLAVGECFDYGNAEGEVLRQPCAVVHDGEIISDVTLHEGPYPGDYGVDEAADRACSHDFTNYVGKSPDESELDLDYWTPRVPLERRRPPGCVRGLQLPRLPTDRHHQEQPPVDTRAQALRDALNFEH
jgi:hypothetical protein